MTKAVSEPKVSELVVLFNQCFRSTENTVLQPGGHEPVYLPANPETPLARIVSTRDYFASALHEISHWCIAGSERRKQVDYGYWYEPDGRNQQTQLAFEQVEVKPQALEWLFSVASGHGFSVSSDNIDNPEVKTSAAFRENIVAQAQQYNEGGQSVLPRRAGVFLLALAGFYQPFATEIRIDKTPLFPRECFTIV